jgi:hypothetical protein
MSNNIFDIGDMTVTAFVGPNGDRSVQINIGVWPEIEIVNLNGEQTKQLIDALQKRLDCAPGYSATD